MSATFFARQTILDAQARIAGYEILYRGASKAFSLDEHVVMTSTVINEILNVCGIDQILGPYLGFIKTNALFLEREFFRALPPERFVFSIFEEEIKRPEVQELVIRHVSSGYKFAVNDAKSPCLPDNPDLLRALSYYKLDTSVLEPEVCRPIIEQCRQYDIATIAAKVETHALYDRLNALGVDYFQGYFLEEPKIFKNSAISVEEGAILMLWNLVRTDTPTDQLVEAFQNNHAITLQLLRFINSSYFTLKNEVTSIRQVITLLGRQQLSQWLLLMLFSQESKKHNINHPLLLMAVNRTEIMTGLLKLIRPNAERSEVETSYLVGMLSMIHLMFHIPHREMLRHLHVTGEIEDAMFEAKGFYGQLLTATRHIENNNAVQIASFAENHGLDDHAINRIIVEAMEKVNSFEQLMLNN